MMPSPDPTPAPPPVLTQTGSPPPVPPKNPWAVNTAAVETGSLYIEYVSTRALGLRGEIVAARYKPASYAISVAIWAIWPTALLIPLSNGRVALAIALALLASLLLNAVLFVILFLVRYPTAASTRKLSYSLQPTGVHGRNPQGTTFKPWSSLRSVQRIEDFLIFDYGATVTAYMPVAAFRDEASADRYMQAVRDLKASNGNFAVIPPGLRAEFATPNPALT